MKLTPTSPRGVPRYFLAATLLAALPALAQTITNPSFETDTTFTTSPGYISSGTNGPITGWTGTPTSKVGLNPSGGSPFADNGSIPQGTKVAFIQNSGSISTTATGLTIGTKYHVEFRVNARSQASANGNLPFLIFSTDGAGPTVGAEIQRVQMSGTGTAYRYVGYDFTATATSHIITVTNNKASGDHTLLLDDFTIAPSSGAWSMITTWDGDSTSGIDPAYVYTHAIDLNGTQGAGTLINGVPFLGRASNLANSYSFTGLNGLPISIPAAENLVTGNSGAMAAAFRYDGDPSITLQNLKPSTQYVFNLYGLGWDAPTAATPYRAATFTSTVPGSEKFTFNLDQRGRGRGMILSYTYTTDAAGSAVTISYPRLSTNAGSIHTSGFSNRQAVATNPIEWTLQPWDDDANSGISPNHLYTHAYKLNGGTTTNVNGVNFTALAGPNPSSGTSYTTSGLPSTYGGDVNNVTGFGAALAKDFVYGGLPSTHTLTGLTPGKSYVFTIYSVGWDDGVRNGVFSGSKGGNMTVLDQSSRGNNVGVRFERQYVADASGTATFATYGFDNSKTIHTYAVSNREADAFVGKAPEFTLQPVGGAVGVGTSYSLHGEAIGSANITYQWKHGLTDIPGETSTVLNLTDIDASDSGSYTLVATNGVSSTSSTPVSLTVLENAPGDFNSGTGVDGLPLAGGQIDPHFKLIVNPDAPGTDTVYVQSNLPGSWLPASSTSKWIGPRADTQGAAAQAGDAGEGPGIYVYRTTLDFTGLDPNSMVVKGKWSSDNAGLRIKVNGTDVGFANTVGTTFGLYVPFNISNAAFPGLLTTGVNTFDFVVRNEDAATGFTGLRIDEFQAIGAIPPNTTPYIAVQPQGFTGAHDSIGALGVGATGSATMTYQWYKGANPISGETNPVLYIPIDSVAANANYKVRVTNGSGFTDSNVAAVSVTNTPPFAGDDLFNGQQNTPLEIVIATELLANDSDIDLDPFVLNGFSATTAHGGTVVLDGSVLIYTPPTGFSGDDSFTYTLNDGDWGGISPAATVAIHVASSTAAEPTNLAVALSGGSAVVTFTGSAGGVYTLQRSTTLAANSWTDVDTDTAPGSGAVTLTDPAPPAARAFYRVSYSAP